MRSKGSSLEGKVFFSVRKSLLYECSTVNISGFCFIFISSLIISSLPFFSLPTCLIVYLSPPPPSFSLEEIDRINWQYMETNVQNSSKVSKIVKVNINHAYNETDIYSEIGPSIQWINQIHRFQWLRKIIYNGSWKIPMNTHYCRWSR